MTMKRDQFLKSLGLGALALAVAPTVIKAENTSSETEVISMAIDVDSISNFSMGGHRLSPADILQIWKETGVLLYKSHGPRGESLNAPMVFKGEIKALNIDKKQ